MAVTEFKFKIFEVSGKEKLLVASGSGNNQEDVERECKHYTMMYSQDSPIEIWRNYDDEE